SCSPATGACSNPAKPDGTSCTDGNACTQSDSCQAGACAPGTAVTCTASGACHIAGTCDTQTGTCSNPAAPAGTSCSDGSGCDAARCGPRRRAVAVSVAGDGSVRARLTTFPTPEPERTPPRRVLVKIESAAVIPVMREAYLHPGDAVDFGVIVTQSRDPQVT